MEKICVAVRMRPSKFEESGEGSCWKIVDNRISLHKTDGVSVSGVSYAFDHVFDENSANCRVYELLAKEIVHSSVEGFNGTAFAYGQTSSGKTFTMSGSREDPGIIKRAVKDIFEKIQMVSDREFLIRISYMEIYNEEIHDLFTVENQKLQIHESLENGIFVAGLKEEIVNNPEQVLKLIDSGEVNRHFGETSMNAHSSRSHTVFRMVIESKGKGNSSLSDCSSTDAVRVSVLNLVDLAGSERIAKTGAGGVRLKEGKHINKSLMVLGNVINKLSDGAKQRGHIPYRDSKLTRILQPALGGNAKTSIICTLAPEEVHVEETKGTLQFASRAKRITNCVQVNEILTDAALLKRQKLEIEELRKKLEGSHAEVLEQEVLKLRNEMLTYELEREKLAMELEEERKSHKERVQCIMEQQMKIDNLSSLVTSSNSDRNFNEAKKIFKEECNDEDSICQGDIFKTPTFKVAPNAFVFKRSNYSRLPDCSPLPKAFSSVADEDTWLKMNKGYVANLDSIQMTPAIKSESLQSSDPAPVYLNQNHEKEEIRSLKIELELATAEKNELEKKHMEQLLLNNQLVDEVSELQKEALRIREIPRRLCESVATCKDIYEDVMSSIKSSIPDGKSATAEVIYATKEIGASIFSSLESHFSAAMDGHSSFTRNDSLIQEQHEMLFEKLTSTVSSLILTDTPTVKKKQARIPLCSCEHKDCNMGGETACLREKLSNELSNIKEKCCGLEKELALTNQHLRVCEQRYDRLKVDFQHMKEGQNFLLQSVSDSSRKIVLITDEKENALKDFNKELKRRKDLEEEIKQYSLAFSFRQKALMSFHNEFKTKIENLIAQDPV